MITNTDVYHWFFSSWHIYDGVKITNETLGGDPAFGQEKICKVNSITWFDYDDGEHGPAWGREFEATAKEGR